jgi:hypothetical protein
LHRSQARQIDAPRQRQPLVGKVGFADFVCQFLNVVASEFGIDARLTCAHEFERKIVAVNHALTSLKKALTV